MNFEPQESAEQRLARWVSAVTGSVCIRLDEISGGNRCMGWLAHAEDGRHFYLRYQAFEQGGADPYNIRREAAMYAALQDTDVPLPRFLGVHPQYPALLTEFVPGSGNFRRLSDASQKTAIAEGAIAGLVALHRLDVSALPLSSLGTFATITEAVRAEIDIWHAMYLETGRRDPLIEFVHKWLLANLPQVGEKPSLVHGDAGPGNFMFSDGAFTKLIDWELAHLGDPMEDLAWFSMRSAMEPVPDFPHLLQKYAALSGREVPHERVMFYRVLVSWRVVIIRHRNSSGELGGSIVSRALNRRLVVEALSACENIAMVECAPLVSKSEQWTSLYDDILEELRETVVGRSSDTTVASKGKEIAKAVKYLRNIYRLEDAKRERERALISTILNQPCESYEQARSRLLDAVAHGGVETTSLIRFFAVEAFNETELARDAMGSLASRTFPPFS